LFLTLQNLNSTSSPIFMDIGYFVIQLGYNKPEVTRQMPFSIYQSP